ncbi:MAG: hypothetical protein G01um101420_518 [Parcubacteria group bacterium Gr01-1014_20]|nr:MAG: hypothetical protein G01um101420_518 [Parcubacteria group bacterium Gr01-1014_20]
MANSHEKSNTSCKPTSSISLLANPNTVLGSDKHPKNRQSYWPLLLAPLPPDSLAKPTHRWRLGFDWRSLLAHHRRILCLRHLRNFRRHREPRTDWQAHPETHPPPQPRVIPNSTSTLATSEGFYFSRPASEAEGFSNPCGARRREQRNFLVKKISEVRKFLRFGKTS